MSVRRRAFTLIELLVVIAIIAVLIIVLLVLLLGARNCAALAGRAPRFLVALPPVRVLLLCAKHLLVAEAGHAGSGASISPLSPFDTDHCVI